MTPRSDVRALPSRLDWIGLRVLLLAFGVGLILLAGAGVAGAQQAGPESGTISGRVFDGQSGAPLQNATIILAFPDSGDGSEPRQEVATTGPAGDYEFGAVPAGTYTLSFIKSGYRASSLTDFEVVAGQDNVADFPMPPRAAETSGDVLELDAFVVEAAVIGEMMNNLELRLESDQMLNLLSAEDLSKFAASDVADALKRVAGVNIVEGQFAIIRGLEDRYSSTLYNGAPVPSPDPDRQSVQLDLFPSEIVGDLSIAKTFIGSSPSNSSGGSIDILTHVYPEEKQLSLRVGGGFNERAFDRFLRFDARNPVSVSEDPVDVIENEFGGSIGGRDELWGREVRFKAVFNREIDLETAEGLQESREPARSRSRRGRFQRNGDLALGELSLSRGRFDFTQSEESRQLTTFAAGGFDLDREGNHKIDASFFYVKADNEISERRETGFFPGFDYGPLLSGNILEIGPEDLQDVVATFDSPLAQLREEQDPADGIAFFTVLDE
ncbi:MAG: carboxypeptidase-like regulatory domain-containing protein, partial [bacterium]